MKLRLLLELPFLSILILTHLVASSVLPQEKAEKESKPGALIKSNLLVIDSAGKIVTDLKSSDVRVFVNGVEQKLTYFSKKDSAIKLALVFDNSGSFQSKLGLQKSIGKKLVDGIGNDAETVVIRFVSRNQITVEQEWTKDRKLAHKAIDDLFIEGGQSAVLDAIYLAHEKVAQTAKTNGGIVLITDGDERDSYYRLKDLKKKFDGNGLPIFVIAFTDDLRDKPTVGDNPYPGAKTSAEKLLRDVAAASDGILFLFNEKPNEVSVSEAITSLLNELNAPFIIGYESAKKSRDERKLSVVIADGPSGEKRTGIVRGGRAFSTN